MNAERQKELSVMRSTLKKAIVALAALLALGSVSAGSASAATREWLINGSPVTAATPVKFSGEWHIGVSNEEDVSCTLTGKGTVTTKGEGSVTEYKLTKCVRSIEGRENCEEGTLSPLTTLKLPWKTALHEHTPFETDNQMFGVGGGSLGWSWECRTFFIEFEKQVFEERYKQSCSGSLMTFLKNEGMGTVTEITRNPESGVLNCAQIGTATIKLVNHVKAESGELSFR
jgi:hypothetical protein